MNDFDSEDLESKIQREDFENDEEYSAQNDIQNEGDQGDMPTNEFIFQKYFANQ